MRVAFTGSHSTGKTTVSRELVKKPKFAHYNLVDGASRSVKAAGYKINREADQLSQLLILNQQIALERMAGANFVSARASLDPLAYTQDLCEQNGWDDFYYDVVARTALLNLLTYDVIFYFPITFKIKHDGIRPVGEEYRKRVDSIIESHLSSHTYYAVPAGRPEERADYVARVLRYIDRGASTVLMPGYHAPEKRER